MWFFWYFSYFCKVCLLILIYLVFFHQNFKFLKLSRVLTSKFKQFEINFELHRLISIKSHLFESNFKESTTQISTLNPQAPYQSPKVSKARKINQTNFRNVNKNQIKKIIHNLKKNFFVFTSSFLPPSHRKNAKTEASWTCLRFKVRKIMRKFTFDKRLSHLYEQFN